MNQTLKVICPNCGSPFTRRLNGGLKLQPLYMQQRFGCDECEAKFLVFWSGEVGPVYKCGEHREGVTA